MTVRGALSTPRQTLFGHCCEIFTDITQARPKLQSVLFEGAKNPARSQLLLLLRPALLSKRMVRAPSKQHLRYGHDSSRHQPIDASQIPASACFLHKKRELVMRSQTRPQGDIAAAAVVVVRRAFAAKKG